MPPKVMPTGRTIRIDACGLQCPGPIVKLSKAIKDAEKGDLLEIKTTDPAFACDIEGFCRRTGNCFEGMDSNKGVSTARIRKGSGEACPTAAARDNGKNIIVFSGDLDKAIASFIIANGSAAMGRKTSMFFTFWGLNILRKPDKVKVKKDFMARMFGMMMPRGSKKLSLSKMNMGGMGGRMIRMIMKKKNVESLEEPDSDGEGRRRGARRLLHEHGHDGHQAGGADRRRHHRRRRRDARPRRGKRYEPVHLMPIQVLSLSPCAAFGHRLHHCNLNVALLRLRFCSSPETKIVYNLDSDSTFIGILEIRLRSNGIRGFRSQPPPKFMPVNPF